MAMGLQSRRARSVSGTNRCQNIQANKFSVEPNKDTKARVNRMPIKGKVEIEPKLLTIEIKLLKLKNKLFQRGCTDTAIGEAVKEARKKLEADSLTIFPNNSRITTTFT